MLIFVMLFFMSGGAKNLSGVKGMIFHQRSERTVSQEQDGAAGMRTGGQSGFLFWESKDDSFINDNRTREEMAVFSLLFLIDFLPIIFSRLFWGGRSWQVIRLFCMTFREYTMRKLLCFTGSGRKRHYIEAI
ncbi:MAG: hypothetical protein QM793_01425 [Muricomes sp.]